MQEIRSVFRHWLHKPAMFICAFALFQGDHAVIASQLGDELESAPFIIALRAADYFLVMRNRVQDLYTRGWCICEVLFAQKIGFVNNILVAGPDTFQGSEISCLDMSTSKKEDKAEL